MITQFRQRTITSLFLVTLFCSIYFLLPAIFFSLLLLTILSCIFAFEWHQFERALGKHYRLITALYPALPFACMIYLNQHASHHHLIAPLFLIVAAFDTGSYIVGSLMGKNLIAPVISPKKSWQGALGGYVIATSALFLFVFYTRAALVSPLTIASISFITCALALLGDLFESWLKRRAGIKDSGSLLAGHGGLLDRFDGVMFAALFFYLCADWLSSFI